MSAMFFLQGVLMAILPWVYGHRGPSGHVYLSDLELLFSIAGAFVAAVALISIVCDVANEMGQVDRAPSEEKSVSQCCQGCKYFRAPERGLRDGACEFPLPEWVLAHLNKNIQNQDGWWEANKREGTDGAQCPMFVEASAG